MHCTPAPDRPICSSCCDLPQLSPPPICALPDGLVPAVTRMLKSHHINPFHQGEVYKRSLSRTEQLFSDRRRCRPVFFDPCSSFPYTSVNQEPIYWSQQVYLSVNAEVTRKQHQPSCTGPPVYLSLNLKAFWEMPCCLQWAFDQTSVHVCSSTKFWK